MSDSGFREEKKTEREFSTCGPKTSAQIKRIRGKGYNNYSRRIESSRVTKFIRLVKSIQMQFKGETHICKELHERLVGLLFRLNPEEKKLLFY